MALKMRIGACFENILGENSELGYASESSCPSLSFREEKIQAIRTSEYDSTLQAN